MATEAAPQILDSAIETSGLSIVTSTKTVDDPRFGAIYNPTTLAAAIPVWFHPTVTDRYVALLAERWTAATVSETGGPQSYSAYTESTVPSWVSVQAASGATGDPSEIPTRLSGDRLLHSAISSGSQIFVSGDIDGMPHLQHHRVTPIGEIVLINEEILPIVREDIHFDAGVYLDGFHLVVLGTDADGFLYRARKPWGRIGVHTDPNAVWQVQGRKGWYDAVEILDPDDDPISGGTFADPLLNTDDEAIEGNFATYARIGDREWLAVTNAGSTEFYSSRRVDPTWRHEGSETGDVFLQPQLRASEAHLPEGHHNAIPWVRTTVDATEDAEGLIVDWGLLGV